MDKAVLDTDIFSEVLKGRDAIVAARATEYASNVGPLCIPAITVMEITKGAHKAGRDDLLNKLLGALSGMEILSLDTDAAILAGKIYAELERAGQPIGRADPMIAAIAMQNRRVLITGNINHFARIRSLGYPLDLADWRERTVGE